MTEHHAVLTAGVDEAGRGPLAGPVVASAVILDPSNPITGIKDSKQLTERKRSLLSTEIKEKAKAYGIGIATVAEIDELNILQATFLAMQRAVMALNVAPELVLIDGNQCPTLPYEARAIIQGDKTSEAIGAASILAKVHRDTQMIAYDETYPEYGFKKHKGYGTKQHMEALRTHGASPIHRQSFAPVRRAGSLKRLTALES